MSVSRERLAAGATLVLGALLAPAAMAAAEPGPGRIALLGGEAARFMSSASDSVGFASAGWIAGAFCVGLLAAFLGTYCGMRLFAFGRCVERGGWREVTYRFRSTPVAIRGDVIPRMTGLLEELERLGAGRSRQDSSAIEPMPIEAPITPVTFARRGESTPAATIMSREEPAPAAPAARREEPAPAAAPVSRYRRARALLQEGHDIVTIQAMTGLKRAEIDLVRCVPSLGVAP